MATLLVYSLYAILTLLGLYAVLTRRHALIIASLILLSPIDVTAFLNAGFAFTGFFTVCTAEFAISIATRISARRLQIYTNEVHSAALIFILFCALSLGFSLYYNVVWDMGVHYEVSGPERLIRSLVRYAFLIFSIILIAHNNPFQPRQIRILIAIAGLLPTLCVFLEGFWPQGLQLLHNNKTYVPFPEIIDYTYHNRPVGLSNEASFFAYMQSFSLVASISLLASLQGVTKKLMIAYVLLLFMAISISMSRTGLGITLIASIPLMRGVFKKGWLPKSVALMALMLILGYVASLGMQYNILDRFTSLFSVQSDKSTIERYGIAYGLWQMLSSRNGFVGIGYMNYFVHIKSYLPDFLLQVFSYDSDELVASFNLVLQLAAEFGLFWFLLFCGIVARLFVKFLRRLKLGAINSVDYAFFISMLLICGVTSFFGNILAFNSTYLVLIYSVSLSKAISQSHKPSPHPEL